MDKVHFSSDSCEWATPNDFFKVLDQLFNFTLDPCSSHINHKCDRYYTIEDNGLAKSWQGETVYCNPPYGRDIYEWVRKGYMESISYPYTRVVMLLPARTDTSWFHEYCKKGSVLFIKGRLHFNGSKNSAPFPSMLVIF